MISKINDICRCVEDDVQIMKTTIGQPIASTDIFDNQCSISLIDSSDPIYYNLTAFLNMYKLFLILKHEQSILKVGQSSNQNNSSCF